MKFTHINLTKNINIEYPIFKKSNKGWINYDVRNDFPDRILKLNRESSLNKSILDNKITYVCGNGIDNDNENYYGLPNLSDTWNNFIFKISHDFITFGGACFQVILNENKTNVSLYHTDFSKVRCGEYDQFGKVLNYYISNDWSKTTGKLEPIKIQAWGVSTPESGKAYLYYFFPYESGLQFYPIPSYYSAIRYIEADIALSKFYHNQTVHSFPINYVISLGQNPSDEQKIVFEKEFNENFNNPEGETFIIIWNENNEINKPVITPITASHNVDLYNTTLELIEKKICTANRLTSNTLAGVQGRSTNSYNNAEVVVSYIIYSKTVLEPIRNQILSNINQFTILNGFPKIRIKNLDIIEDIKNSASFTQSIDVSKNEGKKEENK